MLYNLVPAGLESVWGATIRRLRYRSTAGYAHLAPCGAKREKQNKTPNTVDSENLCVLCAFVGYELNF
jgi:hypothetical protein